MIIYRVKYDQDVNTLAKYAKNKKDANKLRTWLKKQEKEDLANSDGYGDYLGISDVGEPQKMDLGYSKAEVVHWLNIYCEVVA
tara:strand:+ start:288 stop:536 length:249 start_codon:yes stop_codon:yes gene_type:complete